MVRSSAASASSRTHDAGAIEHHRAPWPPSVIWSHGSTVQCPSTHACPAIASQATPHAPQFWGSLIVFTSHPSEVLPLQSARPFAQRCLHLPNEQ